MLRFTPPKAGEVPARALAQMRLVAHNAALSPVLASAFADGAAQRGMTVPMAEKVVNGLAFMATTAAARGVDDAELVRLTDEFLTKVMGGPDPDADPVPIAQGLLMSHFMAQEAKTAPLSRHDPSRLPATVGQSWDGPRGRAMRHADALQAQLAQRMGLKVEPTMGRDMGEFSIANVAMDLCRAAGLRPFNGADAIRMAGQHGSTDFSYAIVNGLSGVVGQGFQAAEPAIVRCASEVPAADYRQRNSVTLSNTPIPGKVLPGGEIGYTTVDEKGELAAKIDDYAQIFKVSNQALQNDSAALNLFADIGRKMITGAVGQFRNVLVAPLVANSGAGQTMVDGVTLFHADHGNLAGAGAVLSVTSLSAARTAMRRQTDSQGTILAIEPKVLLVPPELETTAQQLVASLMATKTSDANPFSRALEVVTEAGLTNATAWYLLGDPAAAQGLTYAYLDGSAAPRVETREGWNILGTEFRLVWALGAAFVETASWYRNPGA